MQPHDPHYLLATNVILERDGKVLLSRRQNKGWGDGLLCIPGGHVEAAETPRQAAVRELKEELGVTAHPEELQLVCVEAKVNGERHYISTIWKLKTDQEPTNQEPHECSELVWRDPADPGDDVIENFRTILMEGFVGGKLYLEHGF